MLQPIFAPAAKRDLAEILDFIAKDSVDTALRVLDEIEAAAGKLAEMPLIGHVREELADETLRVWPIYSYLIIYRPETQPLEVVRVVSGFRDLAALSGG